ncbi:MAG: Fe-Mn family superoxide dismutase [Methanosarcinales archaeon Met12]|nr:MAG: Fe-Mn family superoxide dismutase [Methanosarcinales archaeon Met12]
MTIQKEIYKYEDFNHLLGTKGFSDTLLKNHFALYQGYVNNINKIIELLEKTDKTSPEFAEMKRRLGWEFNGMRLHELYFGNMKRGGAAIDKNHALFKKNTVDFGSFEAWEKDFKAIGAMRGIGWVILYHDPDSDRLFNVWINEHDVGHISGAKPLLVMDIFEHAYMVDYGLKKADYITAFFNAIDWGVVEKRFIK